MCPRKPLDFQAFSLTIEVKECPFYAPAMKYQEKIQYSLKKKVAATALVIILTLVSSM